MNTVVFFLCVILSVVEIKVIDPQTRELLNVFLTFVFIQFGAYFLIRSFIRFCIRTKRLRFISRYKLPAPALLNFQASYPELSHQQRQQVIAGLRTFFCCCVDSEAQHIAMPSRVVGCLWREFSTCKSDYEIFCNKAFGNFLPYSPVMPTILSQYSLDMKACWQVCCRNEKINAELPDWLPVLFAIDSQLNLAEGYLCSLEKGNFPRVTAYLSPDALMKAMGNRKIPRQLVSDSIRSRLFDKDFGRTHGGKDLLKIYRSLEILPELKAMVFEGKDQQQWLQYARAVPEPVYESGN